jgi:hypothetical protein
MVEANPVQGTQLGSHGTAAEPTRYDDSPDASGQAVAAYYDDLVFPRSAGA